MNKGILQLLRVMAVLALANGFCGVDALAKDKPSKELKDAPIKLDPQVVSTSPFAYIGICKFYVTSKWPVFSRWAPIKNVVVTGVACGSPAALAGVEVGDKIVAIDGTQVDGRLTCKAVGELFRKEKGETISLTLKDSTGAVRMVAITLFSNKKWSHVTNGCTLYDYWGAIVAEPDSENASFFASVERIRRQGALVPRKSLPGWVPGMTIGSGKKKKPVDTEELISNYEWRRLVRIHNKHLSLFLVERENRTVEVIEGNTISKFDDVVGRIVAAGSVITLKPEGGYEIKESALKAESGEAPSLGTGVEITKSER